MEIITLRLIHVLGGIMWVGAGLFSVFFLNPAIMEAGPAAGAVMAGMQRRRLFVVMPIIALLTILSGVRLMWIMSGGFAPAYFATGRGVTFTVAAVAALLAFTLGVAVGRPTGLRMGAIAGELRTTDDEQVKARIAGEMNRLQRRSGQLGLAVAVLLIVAAAGMAIGRYVP